MATDLSIYHTYLNCQVLEVLFVTITYRQAETLQTVNQHCTRARLRQIRAAFLRGEFAAASWKKGHLADFR